MVPQLDCGCALAAWNPLLTYIEHEFRTTAAKPIKDGRQVLMHSNTCVQGCQTHQVWCVRCRCVAIRVLQDAGTGAT